MIAVSSKSRSFESLGRYLVNAKDGDEQDRVAWSASRNLPTDDPELAAKIMRATAAQNVRVEQPVYHLTISFDPGDAVDRAAMERIADRVIDTLGLQEHQVLIVAHADRDHPHMHLLINRVHPETGKVWSQWQDYGAIQRVLREEERALGLRQVPGRLGDQLALDFPDDQVNAPDRKPTVKELAEELRKYERALDAGRGRYSADIDLAAAQARFAKLDAAVEHVHSTEKAFNHALSAVYRDPERAGKEFLAAAERDLGEAVRTLRNAPERFGELMTVKRRGLAGRLRDDDASARAAARSAAAAGKELVEAERALSAVVVEARTARLNAAIADEFSAIYVDPAKARAEFERLAHARGAERAGATLVENPQQLGKTRDTSESEQAREHAARAAGLRRELASLATSGRSEVDTGRPHVTNARLDGERSAAAAAVEGARARAQSVASELGTIPGRRLMERALALGLRQLKPAEYRRLRRVVSLAQFNVAQQLRKVVLNVVLDRDD
jgi:hypothetical protein